MALDQADLNDLRDFLTERLDKGFGDVNKRLDELNGRTRKAESDIVRLQERHKPSRSHKTALWGGISGIAALLAEVARYYFQKPQ